MSLALLVAGIGVTVWLLWDRTPEGPPQIVTLPDGGKIQFIGTTYGTNHVLGSTAARLVNRLPLPAANFLRKQLGTNLGTLRTLGTGEPSLVVWFQTLVTNVPPARGLGESVSCTLADEHDMEAAPVDLETFIHPDPTAGFSVVPRRSPVLQLRFYHKIRTPDEQGLIYDEIGRMRFPNPLYRRYPQWKPEPVPAVKMAGDLEVRLESFMTGIWDRTAPKMISNAMPAYNFLPAKQGREVKTVFDVAYHSPRGTNEVWMTQSVELSDATGNVLRGQLFRFDQSGEADSIGGTLWPDEAAWRLKLELKRSFGYLPEELATFKNVPVPAVGTTVTNNMTNLVNGVELVLEDFERKPDLTNARNSGYWMGSMIHFEVRPPSHGVAVSLLQIVTDKGDKIADYTQSGPSFLGTVAPKEWTEFTRWIYLKSIPTNAQTLDITWVVQKTRTVEFLVKPPNAE
jgi:hypothetical protein